MSLTIRSLLGSILLASLAGATAGAATLSGYTVTDLGAGDAQLTTNSSGNGVVISPDGTTSYAFPVTNHLLSQSQAQAVIATLPAMTNAPVWSSMTYGNPNYAYSNLLPSNAYLNDNGTLLVTNVYGVDGHISGAGSTLLTAQRQPDGSFGPLTGLWSSPYNGIGMSAGQTAQALGLNNLGQVLGVTGSNSSSWERDFLVYNSSTGLTTHLNDLMPSGWQVDQATLDDQGRILETGVTYSLSGTASDHSYLLTPDGVPIDPVPVPEPTALATIVLGVGGLAIRRWRQRG